MNKNLKYLSICTSVFLLLGCEPIEYDGSDTETTTNSDTESNTNTQIITQTQTQENTVQLNPKDYARIVFSGHSLTDAAVPTVEYIAGQQQDDYFHIYQAIPGSPIRARTKGSNPDTFNSWAGYSDGTPNGISNMVSEFLDPSLLSNGELYDTLVITERHDLLSTLQWEETSNLAQHYITQVQRGNVQAQSYIYQSWLNLDKSNPIHWIEYEKDMLQTWECVASKMNLALDHSSYNPNTKVIPAGWAMANLLEKALTGEISGISGSTQEISDLIFSDNVHTTGIGSVFIGAFTYANIFEKTPEQTSSWLEVDQTTADDLFELAWQLTLEYKNIENSDREMSECRTFIKDEICPLLYTHIQHHEHISDADMISGCQGFFGEEVDYNPFRWPDPQLPSYDNP